MKTAVRYYTKTGNTKRLAEAIAEAVEGIDNLVLIRGWDLVPHHPEFYADAYLHPNDLGFAAYAEHLSQEIKKHL
jgi:hypothetical protein